MGNKYNGHDFNPFLFPSTLNSYPQLSLPSSSSSPPPSSYSNSDGTTSSSPSHKSPFQSNQSLLQPPNAQNEHPASDSSSSSPSAVAFGPCAACKILHRRCTEKCYLASYFPSGKPAYSFTVADTLFGVGNVVKFLQQNSNNSMTYVPLLFLLKDSTSQEHGAFKLAAPQQELPSSYGASDTPLTIPIFIRIARLIENARRENRRWEDTSEMVEKSPNHEISVGSSVELEQLQVELEEKNSENQGLRYMLNRVLDNYKELQTHIIAILQNQQQCQNHGPEHEQNTN